MLIIADHRIPQEAKEALGRYGKLLGLATEGITYEAISGPPDIFFLPMGRTMVTAPNTPESYIDALHDEGVEVVFGEQPVGDKYPASSAYNAVWLPGLLIHNFRNTDAVITRLAADDDLIHVDQGYTRCNLLALDQEHFITSDIKVKRVLDNFGRDCLYVAPEGIILPGFKHGFFGGCCGITGQEVFILGSLRHYREGTKVQQYLTSLGIGIRELYDGPLFDGGSILFAGRD